MKMPRLDLTPGSAKIGRVSQKMPASYAWIGVANAAPVLPVGLRPWWMCQLPLEEPEDRQKHHALLDKQASVRKCGCTNWRTLHRSKICLR
jgi:hypothetical protein